MRSVFENEQELLDGIMGVLHRITHDELESVFEEWVARLDVCIHRGGDYVEREESTKHSLAFFSLSDILMLNNNGTPCTTQQRKRHQVSSQSNLISRLFSTTSQKSMFMCSPNAVAKSEFWNANKQLSLGLIFIPRVALHYIFRLLAPSDIAIPYLPCRLSHSSSPLLECFIPAGLAALSPLSEHYI
jgi:hypothetical protein